MLKHSSRSLATRPGQKTMIKVPVVARFPMDIYKMERPLQFIGAMVPGLLYNKVFEVDNIDPNGGAADISIFVCEIGRNTPLIEAVVKMPICETLDGGGQ